MLHLPQNRSLLKKGDPYFSKTKVLLGFDGPTGATTYDDESAARRGAVTFAGNAQISRIGSSTLFDGSSLLLDGTGDYCTFPDSSDLEIGSGAFTLEGWVNWAGTAATEHLFGKYLTAGNQKSYNIGFAGPSLRFNYSVDGVTTVIGMSSLFTRTLNKWFHVAADFDGFTYRFYIDGVLKHSLAGAVSLFDSTALFSVGAEGDGVTPFNGRIKDVRLIVGAAAYAAPKGFAPLSSSLSRW